MMIEKKISFSSLPIGRLILRAVFQAADGPPFNGSRQPWFNYHRRIFRAKAPAAKLTISDWINSEESGGPIGQELIFNFIEVQPFFAEEEPS